METPTRAAGIQSFKTNRGPYLDTKKVLWDTNFPDYSGWLIKRSAWVHGWRKRYFILIGSKLFFAKDEYVAPHGMIDLIDCISIQDLRGHKENAFEIKLHSESYFLQCNSLSDKDEWIKKLKGAIEKFFGIILETS